MAIVRSETRDFLKLSDKILEVLIPPKRYGTNTTSPLALFLLTQTIVEKWNCRVKKKEGTAKEKRRYWGEKKTGHDMTALRKRVLDKSRERI